MVEWLASHHHNNAVRAKNGRSTSKKVYRPIFLISQLTADSIDSGAAVLVIFVFAFLSFFGFLESGCCYVGLGAEEKKEGGGMLAGGAWFESECFCFDLSLFASLIFEF